MLNKLLSLLVGVFCLHFTFYLHARPLSRFNGDIFTQEKMIDGVSFYFHYPEFKKELVTKAQLVLEEDIVKLQDRKTLLIRYITCLC